MSEYVVETILLARVKKVGSKRDWEYFVKWLGYDDPKDNTWEPTRSFNGGSDHFITSFWSRITSHKQKDIGKYEIGTEVFPTGPPRKSVRGKAATKSTVADKMSSASTSEVVEDSENEVRSIIDDDVEISARKRRPSSPIGQMEEAPTKRTRRKSFRAAEAVAAQKATKRIPKSSLKGSAGKGKFAANATKHDVVSRRKSLPQSTLTDPSLSTTLKISTQSRYPHIDNGSSAVSETSLSNDVVSDVENVLSLVAGSTSTSTPDFSLDNSTRQEHSKQVAGQSITSSRTFSGLGWTKSQFPAHREKTVNPQSKPLSNHYSSVVQTNGSDNVRKTAEESSEISSGSNSQPLRTVATAFPSLSPGSHKINFLFHPGDAARAVKGSIMGLFSSVSSVSSPDAFRNNALESGEDAGHSREAKASVHQSHTLLDGTERGPSVNVDCVVNPPSEYGDVDAEGDIDEELLPVTDVAMNEDVEVPVEGKKGASVSPSFSTAWTNTIFGPLGIGRDTKSGSSLASGDQEHTCPVRLSYTVTLPLLLRDIHPPQRNDEKTLDEALVGLSSQAPGKFYKGQHAIALTDALRTSGSCARALLSVDAASQDEVHFRRFKAKLTSENLFVTMIGTHMLALCSSTSHVIRKKLDMPFGLIGNEEDILVAEVVISDDAVYCDAVINADEDQW